MSTFGPQHTPAPDNIVRDLMRERDRFTRQIAGREKEIARIDDALAEGKNPAQAVTLQQQLEHQETFLEADRATLSDIQASLAALGVN